MEHYTLDYNNKDLKDTDINDEFFKTNFELIKEHKIIIDLSNNYLTELGIIKMLQYLLHLDKQTICLNLSNNQINCINNEFISILINFLDKFNDCRISLRQNFYNNNIQDFVHYELLDKIIY